MPANMSLAYMLLPHGASKQAGSPISKPKYQLTSYTLAPLAIMCKSYDKNVIMLLRGEMGEDKTGRQPSLTFPAVGCRSCQR